MNSAKQHPEATEQATGRTTSLFPAVASWLGHNTATVSLFHLMQPGEIVNLKPIHTRTPMIE